MDPVTSIETPAGADEASDSGLKPGLEPGGAPGLWLVQHGQPGWPARGARRSRSRRFLGEPAIELRSGQLRATFLPAVGMTGVSLRSGGREYSALPGGVDGLRGGHICWVAAAGTVGQPARGPGATAPRGSRLTSPGQPLHTDDHGLPIHGLLVGAPGWEVGARRAHAASADPGRDRGRLARLPVPAPHRGRGRRPRRAPRDRHHHRAHRPPTCPDRVRVAPVPPGPGSPRAVAARPAGPPAPRPRRAGDPDG